MSKSRVTKRRRRLCASSLCSRTLQRQKERSFSRCAERECGECLARSYGFTKRVCFRLRTRGRRTRVIMFICFPTRSPSSAPALPRSLPLFCSLSDPFSIANCCNASFCPSGRSVGSFLVVDAPPSAPPITFAAFSWIARDLQRSWAHMRVTNRSLVSRARARTWVRAYRRVRRFVIYAVSFARRPGASSHLEHRCYHVVFSQVWRSHKLKTRRQKIRSINGVQIF